MLETEPQNLQSDPNEGEGGNQGSGHEGGQRFGLLRRGRRGVTRPAGPPAFKSGAPAEGEEGSSARPAGGGGTVPAVPGVPSGAPEAGRSEQGGAQKPVPAAAFQPPVVVFQPPDLAERPAAEAGRPRGGPAASAGAGTQTSDESEAEGQAGASRRRRRGGRGRGKGGGQDGGAQDGAEGGAGQADKRGAAERADGGKQETAKTPAAGQDGGREAGEAEAGGEGTGTGASSRRRRRRRQRGGAAAGEAGEPSPDEPVETVVHIREPRPAAEPDDVRAVKGSTRLEAKRQRRREGRDTGRRRPPIISESEFLARREAVERVMVVRQQGDRTQIAVLEDGVLVEHYVDKASHQSYVGNVYLGKVQNVLPSMEAAFVDIGKGRNAVLYAGEVNFDASGLEGVAKRIESALKSGQSIMVQVTKDPIGHKGARLTSQVSLPGRYLVYVPGASMTGISRKLPDTERTRLKQILKKVAPEDGGIIVRTAAEGASEEELQHDITRLVAQWQAIERKAKTASAPDLLYGEPDLTIRVVRDIFNEDFTKLVIASDSEWDLVDEYVRYVAPSLADRLERWTGESDMFAAYRIDEQLAKALDRKVWLPSGGSLVIDTTEAMTVIDVNTGKFTGQGGNLEQTVTRNNLEAAEEIVRQLRLRDVGGIIVIDFIDMVLESNRDLVLRRLIECLARDRTKHQVAEVTSLGLVQMTRKRVGSGLLAAFSVPCEQCNGRGLLISTDLTELPHAHGRNGQAAPPKPGPARSRSARGKAIAQVAATTVEPGAAVPDGGGVAVSDEAELVPVGAVADSGPDEPALALAGQGKSAARSGAAAHRSAAHRSAAQRSAKPESARAEPVKPESPDAEAPEPEAPPAGPGSAEAAEESPRRRTRRSAHREAGPPDPARAAEPATASAEPAAEPIADAGLLAGSAADPRSAVAEASASVADGAAEPSVAGGAAEPSVAGDAVGSGGADRTAELTGADSTAESGGTGGTTETAGAGETAGTGDQAEQADQAPTSDAGPDPVAGN